MKTYQLFKTLFIATIIVFTGVFQAQAQNAGTVTNNNNENVDIDVQESGSQQQGQSAAGGTSEVTVTDEEASDNFWTDGYHGRVSIPPGSASLTCGDQIIAFSRSGGFGLGVGAAGLNFSDNSGLLPEEFQASLTAIQQCAKGKNTAEILDKYVELAEIDKAIANTYLRTVSPEIYATFFVENAKDKVEILSEKSFSDLTTNLRNQEFNQIIEWQDNFYSAGLAEKRVEFKKNQELRSLEVDKQLVELEVFELERKAKEVEAILKYRQSQLNNLLQPYQQQQN
jgi:hypothetical protein